MSSQGGWTALFWAVMGGYAECARLLIDVGADQEAKDTVRRRSLQYFACASFHLVSHFFVLSI